jgi:hypothetical protein
MLRWGAAAVAAAEEVVVDAAVEGVAEARLPMAVSRPRAIDHSRSGIRFAHGRAKDRFLARVRIKGRSRVRSS